MTALPNPFFTSALEAAMPAETAAAPCLSESTVAAAVQFVSPMTMEDIKARPAVVEPITAGATDFPRGFKPAVFYEAITARPA